MARVTGIFVSSAQRIWHAHGLTPHRMRHFKLAADSGGKWTFAALLINDRNAPIRISRHPRSVAAIWLRCRADPLCSSDPILPN